MKERKLAKEKEKEIQKNKYKNEQEQEDDSLTINSQSYNKQIQDDNKDFENNQEELKRRKQLKEDLHILIKIFKKIYIQKQNKIMNF